MNQAENSKPKELDLTRIERVGTEALQNALSVHNSLGKQGLEVVHKNQHGDTALKGDIEAENAVLSVLEKNHLAIVVHSEEHGIRYIGDKPQYLGVLDCMDGSGAYKKEFGKGRYATMFGIFSNTDPEYRDYLFSGIMEHASGRLFYAVKGKGAFVLEGGQAKPIHCRNTEEFDFIHVKLLADTNFDEVFHVNVVGRITKRLSDSDISCLKSSAAHYSSLVNGEIDGVIECTRKGNLEIATAYGLVTEAGGAMVTLDGISIGNKKYLEFGQEKDIHIPIITAATKSLASSLISKINYSTS